MTENGWSPFTTKFSLDWASQTANMVFDFAVCEVRPSDCFWTAYNPKTPYPTILKAMIQLSNLRRQLITAKPDTCRLDITFGERKAWSEVVKSVRKDYNQLCDEYLFESLLKGLTKFCKSVVDFDRLLKQAEVGVQESDNDAYCVE